MIAYRWNNVPLALRADAAQEIVLELVRAQRTGERAQMLYPGDKAASRGDNAEPYDVVNGVAIVPVMGVLLHGFVPGWGFGATSYQSIDDKITAAIADAGIRAIVMHIDSPGGEVAGCFDLCDRIYGLRGEKPIISVLDESAYSAAYAIASCADMICVPRTGGTGSIGVIAMHLDVTEALADAGLRVSLVHFGERKTELYPFVPLSKGARARLQSDVDEMGEMFVALVARNRGIDADQVRETEAGIFLGANGVKAGLADAVMSCDEAFALIAQS